VNISSLNVDTTKPRVGYICDTCHKEAMLHPGRHWCRCRTDKPTPMIASRVRRVDDDLFRSFTTALVRAKRKL
jgi:hypothetical protein